MPFWDGATHFLGFVLGSYTFWAAICFRAVISLSFATSQRRHFCFDYLISLSIHMLFCFMAVVGNMIAREARVSACSTRRLKISGENTFGLGM